MMVFVFPDAHEYQSQAFSFTGMLIGGVMIAIGIGLLVLT
jgi:F0F1-type ATP synthase assembly protein I